MKHTPEEIKYRLSDLGVQIGNIAIEYITELEKENADLKEQNRNLLESCEGATMMYKDLCKAKEIIKELLDTQSRLDPYRDIFKDRILKAEQFLKETEE